MATGSGTAGTPRDPPPGPPRPLRAPPPPGPASEILPRPHPACQDLSPDAPIFPPNPQVRSQAARALQDGVGPVRPRLRPPRQVPPILLAPPIAPAAAPPADGAGPASNRVVERPDWPPQQSVKCALPLECFNWPGMHSVSVGSGLFVALRRRRSWWRKSTAGRGSHCPWEAATGSPGGPGPEATAAAAGAPMRIAIIDDRPAELETVCSQCLHMNAKIQVLREELLFMTGKQKKCEKLEKNNKKLKQDIVNLKSHIEMNMTEHSQVEQYKQEIEERARQELVEKFKEVNTVLQIQAASQEYLEQTDEEHIAFLRSQMELRIKELASEVFKMETYEADLEKYKKLYLEELKVRKSLEKKLDETNWRLAEMSTELEVEKQQNRSLLSTLTTRPVLEPPSQKKFP
ncbi:translation initiation factor IF-2-like [Cervus elaphus]|uniref:translation initiation factor IF-2-like n=1 Tax=Cervus elaphus TaxID=9860 RepID=UPI001CC2B3CF|nr:translation initiation factor IF-2-like [Cervus elaphus]